MIQEPQNDIQNSKELIDKLLFSKKQLISSKLIMDKKDKHIYPITNLPFKIPNNWEWVYLSDISIIQEGPGIRKHQYTNKGVQFLTVTNILEGSVDLKKSQKYISLNEWEEKYQHFTINEGDIVTACSGASWGKSAIYEYEERMMLNTSTLRLRFFNDLGVNKYLYYLTKTSYFKKNLASHSTGQQPNYGYSHYSKIPIPIPPLEEQKQIVAILDKAFAAIDQAQANIEKNIENAKELFQSKLNAIFSQKGDGWEKKKLGKVSNILNGGTPKTKIKEYWDGDINWITPKDLGKLESVYVSDTPRKITDLGLQKSSAKLFKENSVILSTRAPIGHLAINKVPMSTNQGCRGIVPNKELEVHYLFYYLKLNVRLLNDLGTGTTFKELSTKALSSVEIPIPSLPEQKQIVAILNKAFTYIDQAKANFEKNMINSKDLKKSILQKAFSGELTIKHEYEKA